MKNFRKKFPKPPSPEETAEAVRQRRLGKIVHDDRGVASVEWQDAPEDFDRPVFEVDELTTTRNSKVRGGIEILHIKNEDTFNPYERLPDERKKQGDGTRRDLRKLSEYIKMMRELEERKKSEQDDE